ncbi:hypothetical protein PAXRUDRAFT_834165 [Paxillus rubicundulus Ve08.2h10]|uniref:Uncharacterized protein n=1 Tax=Paxillus rubicundulus Ve08.2h10 TaxID=930991 RepID=A0A0D0D6M7_9AGAM|nr:hypothetical protein PAXRUDRAFT_834165 [Paxillus rubicundulus Ve08.2h10]
MQCNDGLIWASNHVPTGNEAHGLGNSYAPEPHGCFLITQPDNNSRNRGNCSPHHHVLLARTTSCEKGSYGDISGVYPPRFKYAA